MLKTLGRILVILLAVVLVAGSLYWIGQNHPSILGLGDDSLAFIGEGNRPGRGARELFEGHDEAGDGLPLDFQARGMRQHDSEVRLDPARAVSGIFRNILIIALITLLVVGIQRFYTGLFRRRKVQSV